MCALQGHRLFAVLAQPHGHRTAPQSVPAGGATASGLSNHRERREHLAAMPSLHDAVALLSELPRLRAVRLLIVHVLHRTGSQRDLFEPNRQPAQPYASRSRPVTPLLDQLGRLLKSLHFVAETAAILFTQTGKNKL